MKRAIHSEPNVHTQMGHTYTHICVCVCVYKFININHCMSDTLTVLHTLKTRLSTSLFPFTSQKKELHPNSNTQLPLIDGFKLCHYTSLEGLGTFHHFLTSSDGGRWAKKC